MFPPTTSMPTSQIEMTISCRNLMNADLFSKSDPYCIVWMKNSLYQDQYYEVGRTERIDDNLNPEWVKKFILDSNAETDETQNMKFEVWDVDPDGQDFLGQFETTLADIVAFSGRQFVGALTGIPGRRLGEIVMVTEVVASCAQFVGMKFSARNLTKSWFSSHNPFLVMSRLNKDESFSVVFKSETCRRTLNPVWQPFTMRVTTLCNGDYDRTIKIDCYDKRRNGNHTLIGTTDTSLRQLLDNKAVRQFGLINEAKRSQRNDYKNSGTLKIGSIELVEEFSFSDYIRYGTQMRFVVAIDFTASNGIPADPTSLHFVDPHRKSRYEIALTGVDDIIQQYDSSQHYPAFGFGAKLPPTGIVSHQFPLNDKLSDPYCKNVDEIRTHYLNRLKEVQLYGPTNLALVINTTISMASQYRGQHPYGKHYFVLLIITDGKVSDMNHTKHAIVAASALPISIIIVGVGDGNNGNFDAMDELASDDGSLIVDGRCAKRNIVQFVRLNKFLSKCGTRIHSQMEFSKALLGHIPEQLTSFMRSRGIKPDITTQVPDDSAVTVPTEPI